MTVDHLKRRYDYGYWANQRIFGVIAQLTTAEFTQGVAGSWGSAPPETMTQDIARSRAGISLPVAVLMLALGCGRSPSAPLPVSTENPTRTPTPTSPTPPPVSAVITYQVSGVVTDENKSPVSNAPLTLYYENSFKSVTTSTNARGQYSLVFESAHTNYNGNANVVAAIFYTGGGDYENHYVQAVPWGTAHVVKDLRLSRVRTINAGQSILTSIDPDSSLAYDGEDAVRMDSLWEKLHVRVAEAGTLTITARPEQEDTVPEIAVSCVYVVDNCSRSVFVNAPRGSAARRVEANSLFEIRLAIPSRMAPQRYEVSTSLE